LNEFSYETDGKKLIMILVSPENGYMIVETLHLELERPKNQLAAVLKMLIERNGVSERQTVFNGFRTRISELRKDFHLNIRTVRVKKRSQFGRIIYYNKHFIYDSVRPKAIKIYNRINK